MAQVSKDLDVSSEFIESSKLKINSKKRGGPYSKSEITKRRNEAHKLHFGYGYSARKISELMKVNRNTTNRDINFLYSQIECHTQEMDSDFLIAESIERLNVQKTRLCELMYVFSIISEKISLEKMILQIESKIIQIKLKIVESNNSAFNIVETEANRLFKKNLIKGQLVSTKDYRICSEKAKEKIDKILKEDKRF